MYNQYIPSPPREEIHNERREEAAEAMAQQHSHPHPPQAISAFSNLSQALGARLGSIKFDSDTLIAVAVIWFLLSDGEDLDTELLLMIGILLVLGI